MDTSLLSSSNSDESIFSAQLQHIRDRRKLQLSNPSIVSTRDASPLHSANTSPAISPLNSPNHKDKAVNHNISVIDSLSDGIRGISLPNSLQSTSRASVNERTIASKILINRRLSDNSGISIPPRHKPRSSSSLLGLDKPMTANSRSNNSSFSSHSRGSFSSSSRSRDNASPRREHNLSNNISINNSSEPRGFERVPLSRATSTPHDNKNFPSTHVLPAYFDFEEDAAAKPPDNSHILPHLTRSSTTAEQDISLPGPNSSSHSDKWVDNMGSWWGNLPSARLGGSESSDSNSSSPRSSEATSSRQSVSSNNSGLYSPPIVPADKKIPLLSPFTSNRFLLTPNTAVRTLKPILTADSSRSDTPRGRYTPTPSSLDSNWSASNATSRSNSPHNISPSNSSSTPHFTPASAIRMLLRSGNNTPEPPSQRRLKRFSQSNHNVSVNHCDRNNIQQVKRCNVTINPNIPVNKEFDAVKVPATTTHADRLSGGKSLFNSRTSLGSVPSTPVGLSSTPNASNNLRRVLLNRSVYQTNLNSLLSPFQTSKSISGGKFTFKQRNFGYSVGNGANSSESDQEPESANNLDPNTPKDVGGLHSPELLPRQTLAEPMRQRKGILQFFPQQHFNKLYDYVYNYSEQIYSCIMTISLIYALFADAFRLCCGSINLDPIFAAISILICVEFSLELLFFYHYNENYRNSLEMYLDLFSIVSLLADPIAQFNYLQLNSLHRQVLLMFRAGFIIRLVSVLRLLPLPLCRTIDNKPSTSDGNEFHDSIESSANSRASVTGQFLSDYTGHRLVIGFAFLLTLLNYFYHSRDNYLSGELYGLSEIAAMYSGKINANQQQIIQSIRRFIDSYASTSLLQLTVGGVNYHYNPTNNFRSIYTYSSPIIHAVFNSDHIIEHEAIVYFYTLLIFILSLSVLLCYVYMDVHQAIHPIERMVALVTRLAQQPMGNNNANIITNQNNLINHAVTAVQGLDEVAADDSLQSADLTAAECGDVDCIADTHTLVEQTLQRLVTLLQISFGDAGSSILAKNIVGDYLDPMIPGKKVYAVFAFSDIQSFSVYTDKLQESVMLFVNQIADILHSTCVKLGGQVNRNIGNSFLLVWKFSAEDLKNIQRAHQRRRSMPGVAAAGRRLSSMNNSTNAYTALDMPLEPVRCISESITSKSPRIRKIFDSTNTNNKNKGPIPQSSQARVQKIQQHLRQRSFTHSAKTESSTKQNTSNRSSSIDLSSIPNLPPAPALQPNAVEDTAEVSTLPVHAASSPAIATPHIFKSTAGNSTLRQFRASSNMQSIARQSLSSFLLAVVKLTTSSVIRDWEHRVGCGAVTLGYGLHVGWAIEGAIGSVHKIDASYLSPNVNIASRLCSATKQYQLPLLMSGTFYTLLPIEIQKKCRLIDVVKLKGSRKKMCLYTFDIKITAKLKEAMMDKPNNAPRTEETEASRSSTSSENFSISSLFAEQYQRTQRRHIENALSWLQEYCEANAGGSEGEQSEMLNNCLHAMQSSLPTQFIDLYNAASCYYIEGDWRLAGRLLVQVLALIPDDGPSKVLLQFMGKYGFRAPADWKGYRQLDKK
jgi:class 3 adenylate cyclase